MEQLEYYNDLSWDYIQEVHNLQIERYNLLNTAQEITLASGETVSVDKLNERILYLRELSDKNGRVRELRPDLSKKQLKYYDDLSWDYSREARNLEIERDNLINTAQEITLASGETVSVDKLNERIKAFHLRIERDNLLKLAA